MKNMFQEIREAQPEDVLSLGLQLRQDNTDFSWRLADYLNLVYGYARAVGLEYSKKQCAAWVSALIDGDRAAATILEYARVAAYFPASLTGEGSPRDQHYDLPFSHFVVAARVANDLQVDPVEVLASSHPYLSAAKLEGRWLRPDNEPTEPYNATEQPIEYTLPPYQYSAAGANYVVGEADNAARSLRRIVDKLETSKSQIIRTKAGVIYLLLEQLQELVEAVEKEAGAKVAQEVESDIIQNME